MKNLKHFSESNPKLFLLFCLLLLSACLLSAKVSSRGGSLNMHYKVILREDTIPIDTLAETEGIEDTVVYSDGADTIFDINESTTANDSTKTDTILGRYAATNMDETRGYFSNIQAKSFASTYIGINLGGQAKTINQGLFGINLEMVFKNSSLPNDGTSDYAWDWMVDLAPEVLRFPSGESSKFMHLLTDSYGNESKGYGFDLYEMARYFNWTNHNMDDLAAQALADGWTIEQEILSQDNSKLIGWIKDDYIEIYKKYQDKYNNQLCVQTRYIDDFIDIVHRINEGNPGKASVKVILTLNIISETATECKAIADYLKANNVNVIGVELGNETYADFYCDALGFRFFKLHDFDEVDNPDDFTGNYWDYVNGSNYVNTDDSNAYDELHNVLNDKPGTSNDMWGDHDFISKFKNTTGFNYKVGLVGKPLGTDYAFRIGEEVAACDPEESECCDPSDQWNDDLYSVYGEPIGTKKKFDAVILHTYYAPDNWKNIVLNTGQLGVYNSCDETNASALDDRWRFDFYDSRLQPAFDGIIGLGNMEGNFKDFLVKTAYPEIAYKPAFDKYNEQLHFDKLNSDPDKKELWVTEYNLKDNMAGYVNDPLTTLDDFDQEKVKVFDNTFVHGVLLYQWLLKNIKINFDGDYRSNFFTISTIQNYAGGVATDLLTLSDTQEKVANGMNICPYKNDCPIDYSCITDDEFDKRNYYMRRVPYFVEMLYSDIFKNNLKYLQSNYFILNNINMAPTVFVDPGLDYLYVYFTNVKGTYQNYSMDPTLLKNLYSPIPESVDFGVATVTFINNTSQLYSTAGEAAIYNTNINACYTEYGNHPINEMQEIITETNIPLCVSEPDPNGCLTADPYTIGYFKIPITPHYLKASIESNPKELTVSVYPNPSSNFVFITNTYFETTCQYENIRIAIRSVDNKLLIEKNVKFDEAINITSIPSGYYFIDVILPEGNIFHKKLIKI